MGRASTKKSSSSATLQSTLAAPNFDKDAKSVFSRSLDIPLVAPSHCVESILPQLASSSKQQSCLTRLGSVNNLPTSDGSLWDASNSDTISQRSMSSSFSQDTASSIRSKVFSNASSTNLFNSHLTADYGRLRASTDGTSSAPLPLGNSSTHPAFLPQFRSPEDNDAKTHNGNNNNYNNKKSQQADDNECDDKIINNPTHHCPANGSVFRRIQSQPLLKTLSEQEEEHDRGDQLSDLSDDQGEVFEDPSTLLCDNPVCVLTFDVHQQGQFFCSSCLLLSYCSTTCRRAHWFDGGHSQTCPGRMNQDNKATPEHSIESWNYDIMSTRSFSPVIDSDDATSVRSQNTDSHQGLTSAPSKNLKRSGDARSIASGYLQDGLSSVEGSDIPRCTVAVASFQIVETYAEFLLEITPENPDAYSWMVVRRFREFQRLHKMLRQRYPARMKGIPLVPRSGFTLRLGANNLNPSFVQERQVALDQYLQTLITTARLGGAHELAEFLDSESTLFPHVREKSRSAVMRVASMGIGAVSKIANKFGDLAVRPFIRRRRPEQLSKVLYVRRTRCAQSETIAGPFFQFLQSSSNERRKESCTRPQLVEAIPRLSLGIKRHQHEHPPANNRPPISEMLIRLGCEVSGLTPLLTAFPLLHNAANAVLDGFLTSLVCKELDNVFSADRWGVYVGLLKNLLWVDGVFTIKSKECTAKEKAEIRESCLARLKIVLAFAPYIFGRERTDESLRNGLNVFEYPRMNRHLVFHLLDLLMSLLLRPPAPAPPASPKAQT
eukprot:m.162126 g.162126  ORF g.162126 m.162126 type:complete len:776 (-) comp24872_c0_seq3:207-2534(-)